MNDVVHVDIQVCGRRHHRRSWYVESVGDVGCAQLGEGRLDGGNRSRAGNDTAQGTGRTLAESPPLRHGEALRLLGINKTAWTQVRADGLTGGIACNAGY